MPSFRQVGHCSLAVLPQPGVSQVPKVDIFQEHEDFGRAVTTVTPTLSLTTFAGSASATRPQSYNLRESQRNGPNCPQETQF
jgi:hypothetical protein